MKVKCLLVDDEPLAIKLIQNHIAQLDALEVVATCSTAVKALEILRTVQIDLMFLDIKMPQMTGIDFLKSLKDPPEVIITTAHREYAVDGYDLDIIDYLLKPITFERFFKSIDRYLRSVNPDNAVASTAMQKSYLFIKSGSRNHRLDTDDILYIESLKDNIVVVFDNGSITIKYKISDLEADIVTLPLLRIHRSFIINVNKIASFTSKDIMVGGKSISIGPNYKEYVLRKLQA
ncbi:LytTR family DNA-binding domain-containing protein [Pedobacter aquatilis]|uniref:LytR/AlgR family response regulator transcription factor n=1 Tax=Pedobacter aquatilis TaxID=351343 RepID=UPI002930A897|nr:LytTR family DNA-binding domain-containing protein [Pedobacter aquatilis]